MTLALSLTLKVLSKLTNALDLSSPLDELSKDYSVTLGSGNGANQGNSHFHDTRTLAASATEELDLAGGLTGPFGATVTFTKVKALIIRAASGNVNDVLIGGAAVNAWVAPFGDATDVVKVKPGGTLVLIAPDANGYAVTAGTGDKLKVANSAAGTSVTYDVIVIGVE